MSLVVSAVQNDAQGETNCVYVAPSAKAPAFIKINGFIFTVRADPAIPDGVICLNAFQRKTTRLTTLGNDVVDLAVAARDVPTTPTVIAQLKIELSYVAASKNGGSIDYPAFMQYMHKTFVGQYLTTSQQLLVLFEGNKFIAVVKEVEALQKGGGHDQAGMLVKDTVVIVECTEKSGLKMVNIPAESLDAQREQQVKNFDLETLGIGGLKKEFGEIFRRAFATRIYPQSIVKKLGVSHIKGVLLYGPPGTGKTLIARKIGEILNVKSVQVVNGPEVFNKWVGGAEENIRKLFAQAEEDQKAKGDLSPLHLIIFDEFDSIAKQRGSGGAGGGVGDNVVNQLLSKIDGVNQLNNILLIGATNRKDLIDEAILRPGRFEVHVEIGLPDEPGREEILKIHTRRMRENDALGKDVDISVLARETKNYSGAELRGLVDAASAHAFTRHIDPSNPTAVIDANNTAITMADFQLALDDVKPAFGQAEDACKNALRRGIINYGPTWQLLDRRAADLANSLRHAGLPLMSVLIHGSASSGKSAFAAHTAMLSDFPFVKFITNPPLVGYGEAQKCNIVRRAFDDSYKSPLSVIVLDDIERLIEYSGIGGRYSNMLLQSLLVLIKNPPPDGRKLLVIATTSNREALAQLELTDVFTSEIEMPTMEGSAVRPLSEGLNCAWRTSNELELAAASIPDRMPLKRLLTVLEMSAEALPEKAPPGTKRVITYERFSDALLMSGTK